jgi:VWFA-related protein
VFAALACLLIAQQPPTIRTSVPLVVVPATVTDASGRLFDGLTERDFVLRDNGQARKIDVDTHHQPLSLAIVVETAAVASAALAHVRPVGSMIEPLVTGTRGEASVIAYDDDVRVVQGFTRNPVRVVEAMRNLRVRGSGGTMLDAVAAAVRDLSERPPGRRRVILLIGESKDRSSKAPLEEVVTLAQRENVVIYAATFSPFATALTAKAGETSPGGGGGFSLLAVFREIARLGKEDAAEALMRYTGGRRFGFVRQEALEQAVSAIGEELHGQYVLSFTPENVARGEFRRIEVALPRHPALRVRTRPGYWMSPPE